MKKLIFAVFMGIFVFLGSLIFVVPFTYLFLEFEYSIIKWILIVTVWLAAISIGLLAGVDTYIDEKKARK